MTFGKSIGGGRRLAQREHAPVLITFTTLTRSASAILADFSSTGARLRGVQLPSAGEEIILRIERLRTYATVAWSNEEECGVTFDLRLPGDVMASLRASFRLSACRTVELQVAHEDWTSGLAR